MALTELQVQGYRSLRNIRLPLYQLNVVTGPNGSGKSNLYRALWLISQIADGGFARSLCREGGFLSALWAGPRTSAKPVRMTLGFRTEDLQYELSCGFPQPSSSAFVFDPEIKEETIWHGAARKPSATLLHRKVGNTTIRDLDGQRVEFPLLLDSSELVLNQLREPHRYPELLALREEIRAWRFYHQFRTDEQSPLRSPRVGVRTPVLSHDGSDLAAALLTIEEIGDGAALHRAISSAFPGRELEIEVSEPNPTKKTPGVSEFVVTMSDEETLTRTLRAHELSDGTLKFLCLTAALLSPRPPALIALNEPEASLHPDLLEPLARLIVDASKSSQIWITTHSPVLVQHLQKLGKVLPIQLRLDRGETILESND